MVKDEYKWLLLFVASVFENIIDSGIGAFLDECNAALVYAAIADLIEAGAWYRLTARDGARPRVGLM